MSILCRLEYMTRAGWVTGHAGIALLDPGRYVERLAANGKFGRALELDDRLQPTLRRWEPAKLPDPKDLVPATVGNPAVPQLRKSAACPHCDEQHSPPYDGRCMI